MENKIILLLTFVFLLFPLKAEFIARNTGSTCITIPGPPPYALWSTRRCFLSNEKSLKFKKLVLIRPFLTARPKIEPAKYGLKNSGNKVITLKVKGLHTLDVVDNLINGARDFTFFLSAAFRLFNL